MLDIVEREIVAGQVEQGVEQHRAVPARENEAVPIGPEGIARVVLEEVVPQHVRHRRRPQRHSRMTGVRLLDGVDRERANGVDRERFE